VLKVIPALAVALLAACQPSQDEARITLRFWGLGREGEVVAELLQGFERENPGIRIESQQIPWTAAHEKLLTAHVGGSAPDLAQMGNTWVPEFAAIKALQPLDPLIAASQQIQPGKFFRGIWDTSVVNDTVFGVPWYVDTRLLFYRKDILAAAGYDSVPQSWTGWLEAMRAVKRQLGPDGYAIYLPTNEWMQPVVLGMQNGATLLDAPGARGAFSAPEFARAFDFYLQLFREGLAPPLGLHEVANVYQEFARGFIAMWITGPWNMAEFKRRLPVERLDDWATAPLPGPHGAASGLSYAGGASLVIFRNSRHPAAAWKVIEYLSRPEQQQRFYELTGSLPAVAAAWPLARLSDDPHARAFLQQLQLVRALPAVPEIETIVTRVYEHAELSIRGNRDATTTLRALDADVDRILEKRRWMLERSQAQLQTEALHKSALSRTPDAPR
jgi:multiple sugar transport system substrate-binding protein